MYGRSIVTQPVIFAEDLEKSFGQTHALRGVSIDVPEGTILALLGPNGAGKTTTVRILTTLSKPDRGRAFVAGFNVLEQPAAVRQDLFRRHAAEARSGRIADGPTAGPLPG